MSVHEVIALFIYGFAAAKDVVASLYIGSFFFCIFIIFICFEGDNQPKIARMSTFVCLKYRFLLFC
jgi:hypothetical protein